MANELKHADIGEQLTKPEWEALNTHIANGQTTNDMLYFNGTYWIRATPATIRSLLNVEAPSDTAYAASWNGVTTIAPSKNAVYDKIESLGGAALTVAETEVFNGTSPAGWADLDLSGTIGANPSLVLLKFKCNQDFFLALAARKNGDTDQFYSTSGDDFGAGVALSHLETVAHFIVLWVATSSAGVIEWRTEIANASTVDIIAYIN